MPLVPFFESLVWLNRRLKPSLPDHWWTLYPLDQIIKTSFNFLNLSRIKKDKLIFTTTIGWWFSLKSESSNSSQVSRTLLSILTDLFNAEWSRFFVSFPRLWESFQAYQLQLVSTSHSRSTLFFSSLVFVDLFIFSYFHSLIGCNGLFVFMGRGCLISTRFSLLSGIR